MIPMATTASKAPNGLTFEQQAALTLSQLRASLSALMGAIGERTASEIRKAADLQRALGIRTTLAWQVYKFVQAADPLAEASNVPGAAAMKLLLQAAAKHGVPDGYVDDCTSALSDFEELIKVHAGDRSAFDTMISGVIGNGSDQIDSQQKRAAFRANSHLWGVQAKTRVACYVYQPAKADSRRLDVAVIRGLVGLRRLRRDASWTIARIGVSDDDGEVRQPLVREPLDPAGEVAPGVPLLLKFSSYPLPTFRSVPAAFGMTNVQLEGDSIGNLSAVTCMVGDVSRNALARYQDDHNRLQTSQALVRTPCEVLVHDVLVRDGTFGAISPTVAVYGDHRSGDAIPEGRECDLLPLRESVVYLGKGPSVMHTPAVPRYAEMIQYAFDRLDWDEARFDVYRCRVEYPVMPSSVVVRFDLPERPEPPKK